MIRAYYNDAEQASVVIILDGPDDVLGNSIGPASFSLGQQDGNPAYDEFKTLTEKGELKIGPFKEIAAVPSTVADYQFAGQASAEGIIDFDAAMAWTARGAIPDILLKAVEEAVKDPERQKSVKLFLAGSKDYPRHHPLTPLLGPLLGKADDAALDAFWIAAAAR